MDIAWLLLGAAHEPPSGAAIRTKKCTFHEIRKFSKFSKKLSLVALNPFWAALPGAQHPDGCLAPTDKCETWLVETEIVSVFEEQYFIEQTAGKSWRKC